MIAAVRPIKITLEQNVQTYMATKINNLEYDAPLEVRNWRHPAEIAIVHEMMCVCMCGCVCGCVCVVCGCVVGVWVWCVCECVWCVGGCECVCVCGGVCV